MTNLSENQVVFTMLLMFGAGVWTGYGIFDTSCTASDPASSSNLTLGGSEPASDIVPITMRFNLSGPVDYAEIEFSDVSSFHDLQFYTYCNGTSSPVLANDGANSATCNGQMAPKITLYKNNVAVPLPDVANGYKWYVSASSGFFMWSATCTYTMHSGIQNVGLFNYLWLTNDAWPSKVLSTPSGHVCSFMPGGFTETVNAANVSLVSN